MGKIFNAETHYLRHLQAIPPTIHALFLFFCAMTYIAAAGIAAAITAPPDSYVVRVSNCAGSPELGKRSCLLRSVEGARLSTRKKRSILTLGSSIPRTATAGKNKRELRGRALPDRLGPLSHSWYPVTKKKKNDFRTQFVLHFL